MTALLSVEHLEVRFGAAPVVDDVSFEIAAGEKFALVGESGSGKSITALSVLGLVDGATTTGAIRFDGADLLQASERELRAVRGAEIAMIFQEPMTALNPLHTVGAQISEVLSLHFGLGTREARERAVELLDKTGIPEPARRVDAYPHQLSGGQRQRAMIAMALAGRPKLLIADEREFLAGGDLERDVVDDRYAGEADLEMLDREQRGHARSGPVAIDAPSTSEVGFRRSPWAPA